MDFKLVIIVFIFGFACGQKKEPRLVFGADNNNDKDSIYIKNLAAIYREDFTYCSGYLISEKAILTAAHCFEKSSISRGVYYSSKDGKLKAFEQSDIKVNIHPNYNKDTKSNDFAIISLVEPLIYQNTINLAITEPSVYKNCIVSGLGYTENGENGENVELIPEVGNLDVTTCPGKPGDRVCATAQVGNTARGILCKGDAGAPLFCDKKLVGIAITDHSCGSEVPDVFQKLSKFKTWIDEQITIAAKRQPEELTTTTKSPDSASTLVLSPILLVASLVVIFKLRT